MSRKVKQQDPAPGVPPWMVTYCDLVQLLMCFFVMLFAMSNLDVDKFKALADSVRVQAPSMIDIFGGGQNDEGSFLNSGLMAMPEISDDFFEGRYPERQDTFSTYIPPVDVTQEMQDAIRDIAMMAGDFKTYFAENNMSDQIQMEVEELQIRLNLDTSILFDSGSDRLNPTAYAVLDVLVSQLMINTQNIIRIIGHTDDRPINTVRFPNNEVLSFARASSVHQYMMNAGIYDQRRFSVQGAGDRFPVIDNSTETNRAMNRRVEIIIESIFLNQSPQR
jgi:chemotaxis protein MotB